MKEPNQINVNLDEEVGVNVQSDDGNENNPLIAKGLVDVKEDNDGPQPKYSHNAQKVLSKTIKTVQWVIGCAIFAGFSYSSRFAIWYLYAREFEDATEHAIVWVLWAGYINLGLVGAFYPCLGDVIGYDKALIIKLVIRGIGIFGECIAMNFKFLSVFFIISQMHIVGVCLAFIAWILPHKYAVQYTSYLYGGYAAVYLVGPLIAGILSHFINYRSVFWCTLIFNIIMIIIALLFIAKKQKILEMEQMKLKQEFAQLNVDEDYIFPIIRHSEDDRSDFRAFWFAISKFEWFQLMNVITQNALMMSVEALFVTYFAVFITDSFGSNAMIATSQLFCVCFGFIVGNAIVPSIINKTKLIMSSFNTTFIIIITSSIIMIMLFVILFPLITKIYVFWIINTFIGLFLGMTLISTETLILKHQPTQHTGKISGIKEFVRKLIPAIAILITGTLYAQNVTYAFAYVSAGCYVISLFFSIVFILSYRDKQPL